MPQNRRSYEKTRRIALSGLLFALAMALSFIEGTLTIPGLLPGMKLGLANIVVMYALFFMGPRQALVLDVLKALFVFLVSGFTAGLLSLCGGLLSLLVMWVLYYLLPVRPTWFILSVCGALAHNIGQLLGAGVIISSSLSFYYAPVMLVLGLVMGALTSITLKALLPALGKWASPHRKSGGNNQPSMQHSCILAGNQYNKETTCYFKDKISCIQRCRRGKVRGSREVFAL